MTSEYDMERQPSKLTVTVEDPIELLRQLAERNPSAISKELQYYLTQQKTNVTLDYSSLEQYGPPTLEESMTEMMTARAQEISLQYFRDDISLLSEALGSVGMSLLDLSRDQLEGLGEIEATIENNYGLDEQDDEFDEEDEE